MAPCGYLRTRTFEQKKNKEVKMKKPITYKKEKKKKKKH